MLITILYGGFVKADEPPSYLLLREDAQQRLDSLNQIPSNDNLLERIILMHNLAFHGDKDLRETAEKLLKDNFKKNKYTPLVEAYDGSLRIIKVKHRSAFSNLFRNSVKDARKAFEKITDALEDDPNNMNIRFVRASAAVEVAKHIPKLLYYADEDLLWLEIYLDHNDSVMVFFYNLTMAKYYYKEAKINKRSLSRRVMIEKSIEYICLAYEAVCSEVYAQEQNHWENKIFSLEIK